MDNIKKSTEWTKIRILYVIFVIAVTTLFILNLYTYDTSRSEITEVQSSLNKLKGQVSKISGELEVRDRMLRLLLNESVLSLEMDLEMQAVAVGELDDRIGDVSDEFANQLAKSTNDFSTRVGAFLDAVVSVQTSTSLGSGVIVHPDGYIITNNHVIADTEEGYVKTRSNKKYSYQVVARNKEQDLALLKADVERKFAWLPFVKSDDVKVGTRVVALGSPLGFDFTVTEGIISALNRVNSDGVQFVQMDVSVNPGNSGGPLVNINGEIVGITNRKVIGTSGIGFAIEADEVTEFLEGHLPT